MNDLCRYCGQPETMHTVPDLNTDGMDTVFICSRFTPRDLPVERHTIPAQDEPSVTRALVVALMALWVVLMIGWLTNE